MEESHEMSEEIRQRLVDLYAKGIMTDEILISVVESVERRRMVNKRALKKIVKKTARSFGSRGGRPSTRTRVYHFLPVESAGLQRLMTKASSLL